MRVARKKIRQISCSKNEMNPNKTKDFDLRQEDSVVYQRPLPAAKSASKSGCRKLCFYLSLLISASLWAQDRTVDPTWLHRYVPHLSETKTDLSSATCHSKPIFGEGDTDSRILRSVSRFAEVTVDAHGNCQNVAYDHEEEIYFVLQGTGTLQLRRPKRIPCARMISLTWLRA